MTTTSDRRHQLSVEYVPIDQLVPHPGNPRRGNPELIAESLAELAQFKAITVNRGSLTGRPNEILAGHHLVLAANSLHWQEVAVSYVDVDDVEAVKIMLADNRTSDVATYDDLALLDLLANLPTLAGTGYLPEDVDALERLLADYDHGDHGEDQDIIDDSDESMWPEVRAQLAPDVYRRFLAVPGTTDSDRVVLLLTTYEGTQA